MTGIDVQRWEAVRDRTADGAFVFGVRTTGIACRPGCPARTPRRENVLFFDDFVAARAAGFRACKRCAPDDVASDAERARLIARACAMLDADDEISLDRVARDVGLSRFYFQRLFRRTLGVTPGDYRRALREERLRAALGSGQRVTQAIADAGYGSASRAYESVRLGMTPSAYRAGGRGERIAYATGASSLGRVLVARTARGVCAIELAADDRTACAALRRDFPHAELVRNEEELREDLAAALALADGDGAAAAALDLDLRGCAFQTRVWNALRTIPPGERRSYGQVAEELGRPGAARAVAASCAGNRLALAVPCHRVVGADGTLRGYRWGVERKAALLRREERDRTSS